MSAAAYRDFTIEVVRKLSTQQGFQVLPRRSEPEPALIRWSVQEIRRIATRLAQRRIQPARVIAWSLWRRAHQAAA
jgi:hypothetical protein